MVRGCVMGYQKISNDNGRVGGTFEDFTTEHVTGKFEYDKRDRSLNDKVGEEERVGDEAIKEIDTNDSDEIVREVSDDLEEN